MILVEEGQWVKLAESMTLAAVRRCRPRQQDDKAEMRQAAMVEAWRRSTIYDPSRCPTFEQYAARPTMWAAMNCFRSMVSRRNPLEPEERLAQVVAAGPDAADTVAARWRGGAVEAALAALSPTEREVVIAHYWEGETLTGFAEAQGLSRVTMSHRHQAALNRLRRVLCNAD